MRIFEVVVVTVVRCFSLALKSKKKLVHFSNRMVSITNLTRGFWSILKNTCAKLFKRRYSARGQFLKITEKNPRNYFITLLQAFEKNPLILL
jgi:hypothetical protein